ncbi:neurogenic differentiation factor 2 isoform X2 [Pectinophora gossypiella]|uniref:neurogenic differentiation factor 2 isoform X2 n=1 Tax=Pectinophora gossypiella TaxID=13191 RepID=UPI00214F60A1|nr:neurogenic differentiation factor 2 isoform X2 [Pectinophora gossypiella]
MSSYGSMSPSDEGFDRYEPPFYCPPAHHGSPMDGAAYWPAVNGEGQEFDTADMYHDTNHYIGRSYGYEDMQMSANEPYDTYHNMHHTFAQNNSAIECDMQPLPLRYERTAPSFVRVVKRRSTANRKERRRTQSINTAFSDLRDCIPNVPPDTKLSKIKTLRLATSYISYLLNVLETDGEPAGGFRAELHHAPPRRRTNESAQSNSSDKRGKGRTGWPQHVWALELKTEQSLPS